VEKLSLQQTNTLVKTSLSQTAFTGSVRNAITAKNIGRLAMDIVVLVVVGTLLLTAIVVRNIEWKPTRKGTQSG
jgi:hypothetical protein